jgi:hypothetical protein
MSSAKSRYLECLIESHKSLTKTLKNRGPSTDPCGTPDRTLIIIIIIIII